MLRAPCELLPDWYEDWLRIERERFRELRIRALEAVCQRLIETGGHSDALEVAMDLVQEDPLRESAHRALIKVYLAEGNHANALGIYRAFCGRLFGELRLRPSSKLDDLMTEIADCDHNVAPS